MKVASGIPSLIFRALWEVGVVPLPLVGPTGELRIDPCRARWYRFGISDATAQEDSNDDDRHEDTGGRG